MTDVVDSGELLRRIQRARSCAHEELLACRARGAELARTDRGGTGGTADSEDPGYPGASETARDARVRGLAYEAVLRVLDEILTPGRSAEPR
ncbi:hypothetical protein OHS71_37895 [Streptomyces sp. NBC_00377]|uniref:hypothetical protein n=1 Tax=unclassified Streptomyces TaxID=2593676 RepID=UPI002E1A779A|nr:MULTISPECIES: hypothetical protein [unclassified Streptomyces]